MKKKVYLAVPIIKNFDLELTNTLGNIIRELDFEIVSPWVFKGKDFDLSPHEVFVRDTSGVKESDILIAEVSNPSHGVGMEIMLAYLEGKKIIALSKEEAEVSLLLKGVPGIKILIYKNLDELKNKIAEALRE